MKNMLVLNDLASLQLWRQHLRNTLWSRNLPAVLVQFPEFSTEKNQNLAALASGFQKACGCSSSGFFMSATIVTMVSAFFISGNHLFNITFQHILLLVGYTVVAALCGKFLGLFWARWRLFRLAAGMREGINQENSRAIGPSTQQEA